MSIMYQKSICDARVSVFSLSEAAYPKAKQSDEILRAIRQNCENLGWADGKRGAFGNVIEQGSKVVIKPNLVLHENEGSGGLLPLVTHQSVIEAVVAEALKADPERIIVGDAPIQSCDLQKLLNVTGLGRWADATRERDARFKGIRDFRRTTCIIENGVRIASEDLRPVENYVLYDLGRDSLLEPISEGAAEFRVTCYDPRLLRKTHHAGRHQYLIAREVIDADVVINLPKLKTHKKAGITNALKNLVGINGNKEFLPHHRLGGSGDGGDCYPGRSRIKSLLETVLDHKNSTSSRAAARAFSIAEVQLQRLSRISGDEIGVEGSWAGNQTVARMTLDLNRILLYGRTDATLDDQIQRRVIHICDAIIAGQGDGPLAPEELPIGMILASENPAAMDWIGAHLLGYDAGKIPLLQNSFDNFRWPIALFNESEIEIVGGWSDQSIGSLSKFAKAQSVKHPAGWRCAAA